MWHHILGGHDGKELVAALQISGNRKSQQPQRVLFPGSVQHAWRESRHSLDFQKLSGPWMGRGRRCGSPYTWIPNHLSDGTGHVSPRSFLAACREAAIDSLHSYPDHQFAMHSQSIKRGVEEASTMRVDELRANCPWVNDVMSPLEGGCAPCDFKQISRRREDGALERLARTMSNGDGKLSPRHGYQGAEGVRKVWENLGVFERMWDGRVNIPDVFRVGYGLGRLGGVKTMR